MSRLVSPEKIATCRSYREAVRLCWSLRLRVRMTMRQLAEEGRFIPQHVTDYLNPDDAPMRRSLPAERIKDFEDLCGNACITQWLAARQRLTVLEEVQAARLAA